MGEAAANVGHSHVSAMKPSFRSWLLATKLADQANVATLRLSQRLAGALDPCVSKDQRARLIISYGALHTKLDASSVLPLPLY
jgi:hypothetical protein